MNGKNIIFGLCASMIVVSEICAMQLVTRRIPKSMHHVNIMNSMVQKRKYTEAGEIVAAAMFILPLGYLIGQAATVMGCVVIGGVCEGSSRVYKSTKYVINPKKYTANILYDQIAVIGSGRCSKAYIKKEACENPCCCKHLDSNDTHEKRAELFYDIHQESHFIWTLKNGLQNLQSKKEEAKLLLTQNKIDMQGYEKVMGLLEHKKDCYLKQAALFDGLEYYEDVKDFIMQLHAKE